MSDDASCLAALSAGDAAALAHAYDAHASACYGLARRVLRDDGLAQDVVQETFLALWRAPTSVDLARGTLSTWLLTVTHRRAVDAVRREQAHRGRRASLDASERLADPAAGPPEAAEAAFRRDAARGALQELPDAQRRALELAYYDGLTQREIAEALGVPLGTVKTRTFAGLRRLRSLLPDEAPSVEGDAR